MVRTAFTLIELIFAIVVMSIVMLSFPVIMQTNSDAQDQSMAQEAALAASAKMAQILTYQWDERSVSWVDLAENQQTAAKILDGTNNRTVAFDRNATTGRRASDSLHRTFFSNVTNATAIGTDDNGSVSGMDEQGINFSSSSGFEGGYTASSFGYKRNYQIEVQIFAIDDSVSAGVGSGGMDYTDTNLTGNNRFILSQSDTGVQTNLRCARVSLRDGDSGRILTTMYGYAANIGEYKVYSKVHQ